MPASAQQLSLKVALWDQVNLLSCQERNRKVCLPDDLVCNSASGSAVWDIDFQKSEIVSKKLASKTPIRGYVHRYYDQLGTAINVALLDDGGFIEFYDLDVGDDHSVKMRLLRNLAGSVVVIDFMCSSAS